MRKKDRQINIRLSSDELEFLKSHSAGFSSMSHFVKEAIKEFSGQSPKQRLEARKKVADYFSSIDNQLAHIGGNLNQAMHRCNEAAKAGLPVSSIILSKVYPEVKECYAFLLDMRKSLHTLTCNVVK